MDVGVGLVNVADAEVAARPRPNRYGARFVQLCEIKFKPKSISMSSRRGSMAPPRSALMHPNQSTLLLTSRIFSDQIFLPNGCGVSTPEKFSNPSRGHTDNWAQGRAAIHPTDILARDIGGRMVVLENQFGLTDHTHLGQIMTYVTLRDRKFVDSLLEGDGFELPVR